MSTLPIHAPSVPKIPSFPTSLLARFVAMVREVLDVMEEARDEVRKAEERYPFTVW